MDGTPFPDGLDGCFANKEALSPTEASALFRYLSQEDVLVWEITSNGCWERAHEMCRMIARSGLPCLKVFAMSGLRLGRGSRDMKTPKPPKVGPWFPWPMHVAPCIQLQGERGLSTVVLDPAVLDGPSSLTTWLEVLGDKDALTSIQAPEVFKFSTYDVTAADTLELDDFLTDPCYEVTQAGLAELARGRYFFLGV